MTYKTKQQHVGWEGVYTHHPLSAKRFTENLCSHSIVSSFVFFFFFFCQHLEACGILVPNQRSNLALAVKRGV